MNIEEEKAKVDKIFSDIKETLTSKGHDYADADVLSNFKRLAEASKALNIDTRTPYGYAAFMCLMKLDRLNNLMSQSIEPSNESVEDTCKDLIGYATLLTLIIGENK